MIFLTNIKHVSSFGAQKNRLNETVLFCNHNIFFFSPILNMCFGCSKGPSYWDGSFEYPQHFTHGKIKMLIYTWNILKCVKQIARVNLSLIEILKLMF